MDFEVVTMAKVAKMGEITNASEISHPFDPEDETTWGMAVKLTKCFTRTPTPQGQQCFNLY